MAANKGQILLVGDIHLSDKAPASCTDSYNDDIFDLLRQTVGLANKLSVAAVVWAGDIFHHKSPSRTSHRTVLRTIDIVRSYEAPLYVVTGNHDILYDRLDSVRDSQPLGVLFEAGAKELDGAPPCLSEDDLTNLPIYGVPWQQDWSKLEDVLAPWRATAGDRKRLLITHAPIFPPFENPPFEYTPAAEWAKAMGGNGYAYYGHIHESHGVYEVGGTTFANFGAITRGSLHEYNLSREVSVTLWDPESGEFTPVTLDYKPSSEVFRMVESEAAKTAVANLDEFLARVGQTQVSITSIDSVLAEVKDREGVSPELLDLVKELLEASS